MQLNCEYYGVPRVYFRLLLENLCSANLHSGTYTGIVNVIGQQGTFYHLHCFLFFVHCISYLLSEWLDYEQQFSLCVFVTYSMQGSEPGECIILLWFRLSKLPVHSNGAHGSLKWSLLMLSYMLLLQSLKTCCGIMPNQCSHGHCNSLVRYL